MGEFQELNDYVGTLPLTVSKEEISGYLAEVIYSTCRAGFRDALGMSDVEIDNDFLGRSISNFVLRVMADTETPEMCREQILEKVDGMISNIFASVGFGERQHS